MSRIVHRLALGCVMAACLALSLGALLTAADAGTGPARRLPQKAEPAPQHLLIYAQEWSLWPSRTRLRAGTIAVQLWNRGEDSHDTRIRRLDAQGMMVGPVLGGVSITPSSDIHSAVWHLKPGHYEIYCSLPGHLMMGMHATLTVVG